MASVRTAEVAAVECHVLDGKGSMDNELSVVDAGTEFVNEGEDAAEVKEELVITGAEDTKILECRGILVAHLEL